MNNLNKYENEKINNKNHVATPRWVVEKIYDLINIESYKMCWFPFNHYDSQFKLYADDLKLQYKATHIFDDLGSDFFETLPPENCDLMISNPPFGLQNKIIVKSFELIKNGTIKSFALLLPIYTLETPSRSNLYESHVDKLSIIIFKKRIKFLGKTTSFKIPCCFVCYNIESLKNNKVS